MCSDSCNTYQDLFLLGHAYASWLRCLWGMQPQIQLLLGDHCLKHKLPTSDLCYRNHDAQTEFREKAGPRGSSVCSKLWTQGPRCFLPEHQADWTWVCMGKIYMMTALEPVILEG